MNFAPLIPTGGVLGYQLLTQTEATQRSLFERQPEVARDVDHFIRAIGDVATAAELVADRRLLRVALGAFGLDEDISKQAFLRKMLEEGTEDPDAFANRFVDPRYKRFVDAFGFGNISGARTLLSGFGQEIAGAYTERRFEIAVGDQDQSLRLALNFRREIQTYAAAEDPEGTAWFSVMGDVPVRRVFEGAFGLSASFGQLDIDRQRDELRSFSDRVFGSRSLAVFQDPQVVETAIRRYLARESITSGPSASTPGFAALTLLNAASSGVGPDGARNIVLSNLS